MVRFRLRRSQSLHLNIGILAALSFADQVLLGQAFGSGADSLGGNAAFVGSRAGLAADDVSDLIGLPGFSSSKGQAVNTDAKLDASGKRKRMRTCLSLVLEKIEAKPAETEEAVGTLMSQMSPGSSAQNERMSEEQAMNQVVFNMVLTCYQNIDTSAVDVLASGSRLPAADEDAIFKQSAIPPRPTRKQYRLLEEVFQEHKQQELQTMPTEDLTGGLGIPGQNMSGKAKAIYLLLVASALLGGGAWAIPQVLRERTGRQCTSKMMRKAMKAEGRKKK